MSFLTFNFVLIMITVLCGGSDIFHTNSRVTFYPDLPSNYFGYSVIFGNSSLVVGAPKAMSRINDSLATGLVYTCQLSNLNQKNVTCFPLGSTNTSEYDTPVRRPVSVKDFFKDDMWFGASIATAPEGKLIACAPRYAEWFNHKHLLAYGACYIKTMKKDAKLIPLNDRYRLAWLTDGRRKEYGEYGTNLNFYAYGQAGMSIKVTKDNRIIIGAPGLMQWTGGIIDYDNTNEMFFNRMPVANTYFTRDVGPDNYLGYSVESGVFESKGSTLYVAAAPRSKDGFGQDNLMSFPRSQLSPYQTAKWLKRGKVLIFEPPIREQNALNIRVKLVGNQLGAYFGASLCCTDLNGDGIDDLLVGAPNFVKRKDDMIYDQGAVFVYITEASPGKVATIPLKECGHVSGMQLSGARFGSTIASLGDVDGDGYNDIAVGAPWENEGLGAVYIYKGGPQGLKSEYLQRIVADDARGFGMSISKGLDIDANNCSDLAVGAHNSATAYVYRCIPTIAVHAFIKVPDAMSMPVNVSSFQAEFCMRVTPSTFWGQVKIDLKALITIDPEFNRAIAQQEEYKMTAKPGTTMCKEQAILVEPSANLSHPILMTMDLEAMAPLNDDSTIFHKDAARLSENSTLHTSFLIQLMRDCGEDLVCTPLFVLTLEPIDSVYIPGTSNRLGIQITVLNKEEPAYDVIVYVWLPLPPKKVPKQCTLEYLIMLCEVRSPLNRGESETWEVEVEHSPKGVEEEIVTFKAELRHPLFIRNDNEKSVENVNVTVVPTARFKISGKSMPNDTIAITRENFDEAGNVSFVHYFEITNLGPSDWISLDAAVFISPENVTISAISPGCYFLRRFVRSIGIL